MANLQLDNPAGRLHQLLLRIRAEIQTAPWGNGTDDGIPDPARHRSAVNDVLSPGKHVSGPMLAKLMAVAISLPGDTVAELLLLKNIISIDLITGWEPRVRQGLEGFFYRSASLADLAKMTDERDMMSIALCSDLLHRHRHDVTIDGEKLQEIRKQIVDVLREVDDDLHFDEELRSLLSSHLREMIAAIDSLPTWGTAMFQKAVAETVGDLAVHWQVVTSKSGNSPETWAKVTSVLAAVTALFSFGTAVFQAIEVPASPALPPTQIQIINETPGSVIRVHASAQSSISNTANSNEQDRNPDG